LEKKATKEKKKMVKQKAIDVDMIVEDALRKEKRR
jgi:hypothetical protein